MAIEQDRRRQRIQLPGLVAQLHLPHELEVRFLNAVLRDLGVRSDPGRTLGIGAAGGPVTADSRQLRVRRAYPYEGAAEREKNSGNQSHRHFSPNAWAIAFSASAAMTR